MTLVRGYLRTQRASVDVSPPHDEVVLPPRSALQLGFGEVSEYDVIAAASSVGRERNDLVDRAARLLAWSRDDGPEAAQEIAGLLSDVVRS